MRETIDYVASFVVENNVFDSEMYKVWKDNFCVKVPFHKEDQKKIVYEKLK